jgi:cytoplasmic iron level regulating protein YaaA (DUF328/UPF0246 family)
MKIIISPSKTMDMKKSEYLEDKELLFPQKHRKVFNALKKLSKSDLGNGLSIKGKLLDLTHNNLKAFQSSESFHAFPSYTGLVYKNLEIESYKEEEYTYIKNNLRILDALYGVLEPGTLIKPYRLDMKAKIGLNLYKHWAIDEYFKKEQVINLASSEFSKMLHVDMITIHFLQIINNKAINQATYSKMARGKFLNYLIKNKITTIDEMKYFQEENYSLNELLSDDFNLVFTR